MSINTRLITDVTQLELLRDDWQNLVQRSATNEISLTPTWLLTWWHTFGSLDGRELRVLAFHTKSRLVGLAPLLARRHVYPPAIPFRRLELLATGEDEHDEICSDYLGILAERGSEHSVMRALAEALMRDALGGWDELVMPQLAGDSAGWAILGDALAEQGLHKHVEVQTISPYIRLPSTFDAYLECLPSAKRQLVRRSLRDFEKWTGAPVVLRRVTNRSDLTLGKDILQHLHAQRWSSERQQGAFTSSRFSAFHDALMLQLLQQDALDLQWIEARGEPVAVLYNYHHNNKIHFYQAGRKLGLPGDIRAGLVIHACAIRDAIARGFREYDFLAGTARYKLDLATASRPLVRLRATRASLLEAARRTAELAIDEVRVVRDSWRKRSLDVQYLSAALRGGAPRRASREEGPLEADRGNGDMG